MLILIQCPHAWNGVRQRPHHLAARFAAAGHEVRWIEPRYLRWVVEDPARFRAARPARPEPRLRAQPVTLLNGERIGPVRRFNLARQAAALNRLATAVPDSGPRVLWIYNPHEEALARLVPYDLLIYDIMDEYRSFPWAPRTIAAEEDRLLRAADWVFAGTGALYDAKLPLADGRIECVLSGVETELFRNPQSAAPTDMAALRSRFKRLIGYAGVVDFRLDQPLLIDAARRRRDWAFVLVGPHRADLSALAAEPNIILAGEMPYESLPAIYHSWDAAMIPFVENDATRHINPTKMLEYAAAGLPVVTRALPDVRRYYAEGAFLYNDASGFADALNIILDGEDPTMARPDVSARIAIANQWADERSWDQLAGRMLSRVESLIAAKRLQATT